MRNEDGGRRVPRVRLSRDAVSEEEKKRRLLLPRYGKVVRCVSRKGLNGRGGIKPPHRNLIQRKEEKMYIEYTLKLHLSSAIQAEAVPGIFGDDISDEDLPAGGFRRDWELLLEDVPAMYSLREAADLVTDGLQGLDAADLDAAFTACFLALNMSSDGNLVAHYQYRDRKLHVQIVETVEGILSKCPECGEELEEEIELENHHHGMTYTCPACGAEFSFEEESFSEEWLTFDPKAFKGERGNTPERGISLARRKQLQVGEIFPFGSFPQADFRKSEAIQWVVLDKKDGKALLLSERILANTSFHKAKVTTPWCDSRIRDWLNHDFLDTAFSPEEREIILSTEINEPDPAGVRHKTVDAVFLLSADEAKKYMPKPENRAAKGTKCAQTDYWGLRSIKKGAESFQYYTTTGRLGSNSFDEMSYFKNFDCTLGVRPAIWIATN